MKNLYIFGEICVIIFLYIAYLKPYQMVLSKQVFFLP